MQLLRYTAGILAAGLLSFASLTVSAQTSETDRLPGRPTAERIVAETNQAGEITVGQAAAPEIAAPATGELGEDIVRTALQYLGAKYRAGQSSPNGFDCSGFTSYVYKQENINLLRSSRSQYTMGTPINEIGNLQKGDLVFFGSSRSSRTVGHVGIVTDVDPETNRFKFVHASRTGVKVDDSDSQYYSRRYIGARRIISNN